MQPGQQAALLDLAGKILARWAGDVDAVVVGGDFNATTCPRSGYSGLPHIRVADERLVEWSARSGLTCVAPREATWMSMNESRQAVLDCFFWRSKRGWPCLEEPVALEAADSRLDHRAVKATLIVEGISGMLPLEALMRPIRLNMRRWKEKAEDWRKAVSADSGPQNGDDCFGHLDRLKAVAYSQAKAILGVTGGRMRSFIPFHSSRFVRLQARLRLLKAARRDIYSRQGSDHSVGPSRAMKRAWDAGWHPQPATYENLSQPWGTQNQGWTREWLRVLRATTHSTMAEVAELRQSELEAAAERRRQESIDRFWGGGELRRLLHPALPSLHTPALRTHLPNTFVVAGEAQQIARLRSRLAGRGLEKCLQECTEGRFEVANLLPSEISGFLALVHETGVRTLECTSSAQVVTTAQDRLAVIEHALAMEGLARQSRCPECNQQTLLPVSLLQQGTRSISTWCIGCSRT